MKVPVFVIFNYGLSGALEKIHSMFALWLDGSYGPSIQVWEYEAAVFLGKIASDMRPYFYSYFLFLPAAQYLLVRTRSY